MLRVAALSRWHVHADQYVREINEHPQARVSVVWDEDADRGANWAADLGVPFEADLERLFERDDVDAVSVTTPTSMHADVMVRAASAGKHIFTEKVLATTVSGARAIADAVGQAGVKFCISFPRRTNSTILYAKQAAEDGLFGDITAVRVRIAHDGAVRDWLPAHFYDPETTGGGAMMDLGAHGMYLCRWLLGRPKRIVSVFNTVTGRAVDDNTVSVIEFANGAIAVNETSFTSYGGAYSLEVDGTEGGFRMLSPLEGAEVRSKHLYGTKWHTPAEAAGRARQARRSMDRGLRRWRTHRVHDAGRGGSDGAHGGRLCSGGVGQKRRVRVMPRIQRVTPDETDRAARAIAEDGCVILAGVLPIAPLARLRRRMDRDTGDLLRFCATIGGNPREVGHLQQGPPPFADYVFADIAMNRQVNAVAAALFGGRPRLTFYNGNTNCSGSVRQHLHMDGRHTTAPGEPVAPTTAVVVNIPPGGMADGNGAIELWPGSHRVAVHSRQGVPLATEAARRAECPPENPRTAAWRRADPRRPALASRGAQSFDPTAPHDRAHPVGTAT